MQGSVDPDEWLVFKPTLKQGFVPIIRRTRGGKQLRMVYKDDPEQVWCRRHCPSTRCRH